MNKLIFILLLCITALVNAQTPTVVVKDEDGKALAMVNVDVFYIEGAHNHQEYHLRTNTTGEAHIPFAEPAMISLHEAFHKDTTFFFDGENSCTLTLSTKTEELDEVILTSYCQQNYENAVHKIRVIDAKEIEQRAAVNLRDVLATEMNIRIEQDNILGSGLTMQGLDGENVKILIDGVPLIGRLDGNIDLSQINMNQIERIEIVEGPLSVSYGTNALAGTINLITKKSNSEKLALETQVYYESVGQYNLAVSGAKQFKNHGFRLSGGRNYFDGYALQDTSRSQQWKPKEQYFGNFQYKTNFTKTYFRFNNDFFYEKITNRGVERAPLYASAFDDYYYTLRNNSSLVFKWFINDNWTSVNTVNYSFYQRRKENYFKDLSTLSETKTGNENQDTSLFDMMMARGTFSRSKDSSHINYQVGYDLNRESTYGKRIEGNTKQIGDYAVFASAEYSPVEKITFRPGLRLAYNTNYRAPLIPSLNVKYDVNATSSLRLSYGRGFRAPSLKELYMNFVDLNHDIHGNEHLKAETTDAYQISYVRKDSLFQLPTQFDVSFYFNDLKDKIDILQVDDNGLYEYINIGKSRTYGGQASVKIDIRSWKLSFGGNYTGRYNELSAELNSLAFSPEFQSSITREFTKQKFSIALFYKKTGQLPIYFLNENDEVTQGFIAPYAIANLSLSKGLFKDKLKVSTGVKNLMNVTNIRVSGSSGGTHSSDTGSSSVGWGRSIFVSLKYTI